MEHDIQLIISTELVADGNEPLLVFDFIFENVSLGSFRSFDAISASLSSTVY